MNDDRQRIISHTEAARIWSVWGFREQERQATDRLTDKPDYAAAAQLCRIADAMEDAVRVVETIELRVSQTEQHLRYLNPGYQEQQRKDAEWHDHWRRADNAVKAFLRGRPGLKIARTDVASKWRREAIDALEADPTMDCDALVALFTFPPATIFKEGTKTRAFYETWLEANAT